ncbi:MAG: SRPBCC family protein [Bacteroidota bacterium]
MIPRRLEFTTTVPRSLEATWDFFSRPENLEKLTPKDVSFEFLTPLKGVVMYPGIAIQYRVSPFPGFTTDWITEITQIKEYEYFIDDQRVGPFALWHHQHHFRAIDDQTTEMKDILHYQAPLGILGTIADKIFVHRQVQQIFSYREEAMRAYFGQ